MTIKLTLIYVLVAVLGLSAITAGAAPASFTAPGASESQKTFLTGETTTKHVLTTPGGSISCTTVTSKGSVTGPEQSSVTLAPTYSGCEAFGFKTTHVAVNGCTYRVEGPTTEPSLGQATGPPLQVRCPAGKQITITPTSFGVSVCTMFIPEQTATKGHVVYTNNVKAGAEMDYGANVAVEALHYTGTGSSCGNSATHSDATYSGQTTIRGYEDEAHKVSFGVTAAISSPPVFSFTAPGASESQKTFLTGETTTKHVLTTPGGSISCTTVTSKGSVTGPEQSSVTLAPTYSGCEAFGFITAHVKPNSCTYRLEMASAESGAGQYTSAPFRISCPAGKQIEITPTSFGVSVCTMFIPEQTATKGHVVYTNNALTGSEMDYSANSAVEGLHYTGTGSSCGNGETHSDATYGGQTTVKGYEDEAHSKRYGVTVA